MRVREKPNLLLITLDQLRADVLWGVLSGVVPLPNFNRLQEEGVSFTNCYTAAVPCGPARASLLTGLYAFNHRGIRNGVPIAKHHATLATQLRQLGYDPLLFGYCDMAADPTDGDPNDPDFLSYELPARGFRDMIEMRFEQPFAWIGYLRQQGYQLSAPMPDGWFDLYKPTQSGIRAPAFYRSEHSDTHFLTDRTLEALDARRDVPWVAHLTYIRPHPPLIAPAPWNTIVRTADIPSPTNHCPDHPFFDAWFSKPSQQGLFWGFDGHCSRLNKQQILDLRAVYLGLVAEVDENIGRILAWLDDTNQADNTILIVMADHGDMLGDQGFWGKDNILSSAHHIPLIIRTPQAKSSYTVETMVSSVDVVPTILELMGARVPVAMDGHSLLPLLKSVSRNRESCSHGRAFTLTELDLFHPNNPTRFQQALNLSENQASVAVLRDKTHTLVHFNGGLPPLLFDRYNDPLEEENIANEKQAKIHVQRLRTALLDLYMERSDRRLTSYQFG